MRGRGRWIVVVHPGCPPGSAAHERRHRHRDRLRVGKRQDHACRADVPEQHFAPRIEPDERLAAGAVVDGDRAPAEARSDSGCEALRDGLLGGEPRGKVLVWMRHLEAVRPLLLGEHPLEKPLALALDGPADPGDLDHVRAEADQDAPRGKTYVHGFIRAFISRTASSIPVNSARLRMLWPMFISCRCGTVLASAMLT